MPASGTCLRAPSQVAWAWHLAQRPWIVPIPGTADLRHHDEDRGDFSVRFTPAELTETHEAIWRIEIRGERPRKELRVMSGRGAPPKR